MFTGIIRQKGTVAEVTTKPDGVYLRVQSSLGSEVIPGDSVAVNGICLTVLANTNAEITFRLMQETLAKTSIGTAKIGAILNLEQPVAAGERFDGHFVLGHVDGTALVTTITSAGADKIFTLEPSQELLAYLIPKGSIAIDGVSLTIVEVAKQSFTVSIMPYTLEHTTFGSVDVGYRANIEVDMIAKHVAALLQQQRQLTGADLKISISPW